MKKLLEDLWESYQRDIRVERSEEKTPMKPMKEQISITLDDDVIAKIKQRAYNSERSVSQFINLVLKKYLSCSKNEEKTSNKEKQGS